MQNVSYRSIVLSLLVFILCSCDGSGPKSSFSRKSPLKSRIALNNKNRKKIGIREIKNHWYFYGRDFNAETWKPNNKSDYLCKKVQFLQGKKIKWEEDYYYTGKTFKTIDGTSWEKLTIGYDYPPKNRIYLYYTGRNSKFEKLVEPFNEGTSNFKEAFRIADTVLKSFGMSRL